MGKQNVINQHGWIAKKKVTTEIRDNSTTLTDDAVMVFSMEASKGYAIRIGITLFTTSATPNFKYQLTAATLASSSGLLTTIVHTGPVIVHALVAGVVGSPSTLTVNGSASILINMIARNGATPGNFAFQWAQNTSSADDIQINNGSYLEYMEV